MKIGSIGLGNMGTAIAINITRNGYNVVGWDHTEGVAEEINHRHLNTRYLPGLSLDPKLQAVTDIREAVADREILFNAVPSSFIRRTYTDLQGVLSPETVIVNMAKGVEEATCHTSSRILQELFPANPVLVMSGPSVANEFVRGLPCGVVLAGDDEETLYRISRVVETETFRIRYSSDSIGTEWSGILKNIYAIGLGLIDGAGIASLNFKAAFLTKAIEEMADLIEALGGNRETAYYLAGLGDLIATALSEHSHNRRFGELLSRGLTTAEIEKNVGLLPEGVRTLRIAVYLSEKHHLPMPVARSIMDVVDGREPAADLVRNFMLIGV